MTYYTQSYAPKNGNSSSEVNAGLLREIEHPPSLGSKLVECLFYLTFLNSVFVFTSGANMIPYLGGGAVSIAGLICFVVLLGEAKRLPFSFWCALAMNIGATLSQARFGQLPLIGEGLNALFLWMCQLLMFCYLVRNDATQKRVLFFVSVIMVVIVYMSGTGGRAHRLHLEEYSVGSSFGNANQLAYMCGLFSIALLFWSLRSAKMLRPVLWVLAAMLLFLVIRTVSRGGILTLGCGLAVLLTAIMLGRGVRLSGIILVLVALVALSQFAHLAADYLDMFEDRLGQSSVRTKVYDYQTLVDLWDTVIFGAGHRYAIVGSAGIQAHNSFIYTHRAFGGITAWPMVFWLVVLAIRLSRMLIGRELLMDLRLQAVALFGMSLACLLLSNQGYMYTSTMLAMAIVEKYTAPYTSRRIRHRAARIQTERYGAWLGGSRSFSGVYQGA